MSEFKISKNLELCPQIYTREKKRKLQEGNQTNQAKRQNRLNEEKQIRDRKNARNKMIILWANQTEGQVIEQRQVQQTRTSNSHANKTEEQTI